jgi:hypothetical protein
MRHLFYLLYGNLGEQAAAEIKKTWQKGTNSIPETSSFEEKYEIAYRNWIWLAKNTFSFVRKHMGARRCAETRPGVR